MKKIMTLCIIILMIMILSGCSQKRLDNIYFENTHQDSPEEAYMLFADYYRTFTIDFKKHYPRGSQERAMWYGEGYLASGLSSEDDIYRHEFYNYHLSDDRSYMRYSQMYYMLDNTFLNGILSAFDRCGSTKEGQSCTITERIFNNDHIRYGLLYYMEDEHLYLDFMFTVNNSTLFHYAFLFNQDDQLNDVMEMTLHISGTQEIEFETMSYTRYIYGDSIEEFICNNCDMDDPNEGYLEYIYAKFDKDHLDYDYESSNIEAYAHLYLLDEQTYGDYYDGDTQERFNMSFSDENNETRAYTKYIRNTMVVDYSSYQYRINLNEVLGWDYLVKVPDTFNRYELRYGDDLLSDQYHVNIEVTESEYAYFEAQTGLTDDVLSLEIFGLDTPYNEGYFEDKFEWGISVFDEFLDDRNLNVEYAEIYSEFLNLINQFV